MPSGEHRDLSGVNRNSRTVLEASGQPMRHAIGAGFQKAQAFGLTRGVTFYQPLKDDDDNLRGFEVQDADGYVLYFGRPNS